ncbi:unnamed protein product [Amoebophrya sp. A120]|nr:unnamed protein product [Amoebophrya sp. A120]|eukprot:GSA120T00016492001.1
MALFRPSKILKTARLVPVHDQSRRHFFLSLVCGLRAARSQDVDAGTREWRKTVEEYYSSSTSKSIGTKHSRVVGGVRPGDENEGMPASQTRPFGALESDRRKSRSESAGRGATAFVDQEKRLLEDQAAEEPPAQGNVLGPKATSLLEEATGRRKVEREERIGTEKLNWGHGGHGHGHSHGSLHGHAYRHGHGYLGSSTTQDEVNNFDTDHDPDEPCCFVYDPGLRYSNVNKQGEEVDAYYLRETVPSLDAVESTGPKYLALPNCDAYGERDLSSRGDHDPLDDLLPDGVELPAKFVGRKPRGCPVSDKDAMQWLMHSLNEQAFVFDRLEVWSKHADHIFMALEREVVNDSAGVCCFVYVHNLHMLAGSSSDHDPRSPALHEQEKKATSGSAWQIPCSAVAVLGGPEWTPFGGIGYQHRFAGEGHCPQTFEEAGRALIALTARVPGEFDFLRHRNFRESLEESGPHYYYSSSTDDEDVEIEEQEFDAASKDELDYEGVEVVHNVTRETQHLRTPKGDKGTSISLRIATREKVAPELAVRKEARLRVQLKRPLDSRIYGHLLGTTGNRGPYEIYSSVRNIKSAASGEDVDHAGLAPLPRPVPLAIPDHDRAVEENPNPYNDRITLPISHIEREQQRLCEVVKYGIEYDDQHFAPFVDEAAGWQFGSSSGCVEDCRAKCFETHGCTHWTFIAWDWTPKTFFSDLSTPLQNCFLKRFAPDEFGDWGHLRHRESEVFAYDRFRDGGIELQRNFETTPIAAKEQDPLLVGVEDETLHGIYLNPNHRSASGVSCKPYTYNAGVYKKNALIGKRQRQQLIPHGFPFDSIPFPEIEHRLDLNFVRFKYWLNNQAVEALQPGLVADHVGGASAPASVLENAKMLPSSAFLARDTPSAKNNYWRFSHREAPTPELHAIKRRQRCSFCMTNS